MRSVFLYRPTAESLTRLGRAKRFFLVWTPALIGMAVIAAESTPTFSAANTSTWLRPIAEWVLGPISNHRWEHIHHITRKTGHFTGYGTLCILFLRGWLLTLARNTALRTRTWRLRSWALAVVSTALVASADELHQSFLPSRTGLFSDVVLDTCGGIALSGIVMLVTWRLRRGRESR